MTQLTPAISYATTDPTKGKIEVILLQTGKQCAIIISRLKKSKGDYVLKYSFLPPFSYRELEQLTVYIVNFFNPMTNKMSRQKLNLPIDEKTIRPLSIFDLLSSLNLDFPDIKAYDCMQQISSLVRLLHKQNILTHAGSTNKVMFGDCFYCIKTLTSQQVKTKLWIADALGIGYLQFKLSPNVVHILGKTPNGDDGGGTGFLITDNAILTCKHNITDMKLLDSLNIIGESRMITETRVSKSKDIGIIYIEKLNAERVQKLSFPTFNSANILDDVLVMGFPPIPTAADAYLVSQKGEINSFIFDYSNKCNNIVLSTTIRPGNSGGPVISKSGYLVGMTIRLTINTDTVSSYSNAYQYDFTKQAPFYMAFDGKELFDELKSMDSGLDICFENYN